MVVHGEVADGAVGVRVDVLQLGDGLVGGGAEVGAKISAGEGAAESVRDLIEK